MNEVNASVDRLVKLRLTKQEIEAVDALFRSMTPAVEDIDYANYMSFGAKFRKACGIEG